MKSLKESIECVMKSGRSESWVRGELKKLGLSGYEAVLVSKNWYDTHPEDRPSVTPRESFAYKFGIEIEMLCNSYAVQSGLNDANVAYDYLGYYTHTNGNRVFQFKTDSSILSDEHTTRGFNGIECVSPVLNGKDGLSQVKACCKVLEATDAQVNKSTGFHVHISTSGMNNEWFSNVFANYAHLEGLIDSFMARSRRANNNSYCRSVIGKGLDNCHTIEGVQSTLGYNRYHKINPMAYDSHSTIEFRQHQGTVNYTKIENWVHFCAKLIAWSKKNRLTTDVTSIDDLAFLSAKEKTYFKSRQQALNSNAAAA